MPTQKFPTLKKAPANNNSAKIAKASVSLPKEPAMYEDYATDTSEPVVDLAQPAATPADAAPLLTPVEVIDVQIELLSESATPIEPEAGTSSEGVVSTPVASPSKDTATTSTAERASGTKREVISCHSPPLDLSDGAETSAGASAAATPGSAAKLAAQLLDGGSFGTSSRSSSRDREAAQQNPLSPDTPYSIGSTAEESPVAPAGSSRPFGGAGGAPAAAAQQPANKRPENRRQSVGERRR